MPWEWIHESGCQGEEHTLLWCFWRAHLSQSLPSCPVMEQERATLSCEMEFTMWKLKCRTSSQISKQHHTQQVQLLHIFPLIFMLIVATVCVLNKTLANTDAITAFNIESFEYKERTETWLMINSKNWYLCLELHQDLPLTYRRVFVCFKIVISKKLCDEYYVLR